MKKTTHTRISATLSKNLLAQVDVTVKTHGYSNRSVFIEEALDHLLKTKTATGHATTAVGTNTETEAEATPSAPPHAHEHSDTATAAEAQPE